MSKRRRLRKRYVLGIVLLGVGLLVFMYGPRCVRSDIPCFETPAWGGYYLSDLNSKPCGPDGDELLLTRHIWADAYPILPGVYRYSPAQNALEESTQEEWDNASSTAWKCTPEVAALSFDDRRSMRIENRRFIFRGTPIETGGGSCIRHHVRPDGRLVAVLSADGWRRPYVKGFMPFLGGGWGGGWAGQHYVDLYGFPSMERIRGPLRIPFTTAEGLTFQGWSEYGAYLFFAGSSYKTLCIIRTEAGEQKESSDE